MKELFFSELRRFKSAALITAGVHLALQLFAQRMSDLLQQRWEIHMVVLGIYTLAGLAFAMIQFGSYRQPGRWLWLLHRPVSHLRVFGAIALASGALIIFAIGLPALLSVAGADLLSERTVDTRHYLLVLFVVLMTSMAWLAGSFAILSGRRTAIAILLLPLLMLMHLASGWALVLPALACLALLAYIAYSTFKPNRTAEPSGLALVATAAPLVAGLYVVLTWSGSLLYQQMTILAGVHPLNRSMPPAGGYTESTRTKSAELMLRGLASAVDPRAPQWQRQVPLLEIANFQATANQYPVRHQLSNLDSLRFDDALRHLEWTFSHDAMRFQGRDKYTGRHAGWLGLGGIGDTTPFLSVPVTSLPYIVTPHALLTWNEATGRVHRLIELAGGETLAREPKLVDNLMYVITNQRLIAFDKPADGAAPALLAERFSVSLPEPLSSLDRVDIATLMDGKLVSLSYGSRMARGAGEASQIIVLVDAAGRTTRLAQRPLTHDFPILFEHHKWWISPVLYWAVGLPDTLLDNGYIADQGHSGFSALSSRERPREVWLAALTASLLSAIAAWHWLRRVRASRERKAGWIGASLLLGPPALACLVVLQAREPRTAPNHAHFLATAT